MAGRRVLTAGKEEQVAKVQVLVDGEGHVIGTSRIDAPSSGEAPPQPRVRAAANQRIREIDVEDNDLALEPSALHHKLETEHLE